MLGNRRELHRDAELIKCISCRSIRERDGVMQCQSLSILLLITDHTLGGLCLVISM